MANFNQLCLSSFYFRCTFCISPVCLPMSVSHLHETVHVRRKSHLSKHHAGNGDKETAKLCIALQVTRLSDGPCNRTLSPFRLSNQLLLCLPTIIIKIQYTQGCITVIPKAAFDPNRKGYISDVGDNKSFSIYTWESEVNAVSNILQVTVSRWEWLYYPMPLFTFCSAILLKCEVFLSAEGLKRMCPSRACRIMQHLLSVKGVGN